MFAAIFPNFLFYIVSTLNGDISFLTEGLSHILSYVQSGQKEAYKRTGSEVLTATL
jgi:hypothetical protein